MKDIAKVVDAYVKGRQGSRDAYVAGINGVQENPLEAAAAQSDRYVQGVQEAVSSGRWQAGLRAVPFGTWKSACTTDGVGKLIQVSAYSRQKFQAEMGKFMAYMAPQVEAIKRMAKGGEANAIARSSAMISHNIKYKKNQ